MKVLTCAHAGCSIYLGKQVANSGEGTVWQTNLRGYLAKLYHFPNPERVEKLQVMVASPPREPMWNHHHICFAWPQDLLKDDQGNYVGFLMPEIYQSVKLPNIYNPRLRNRQAPQFNWYYLHTTALNIASMIQAIHAEGYVVGDIKPQNLLVNSQALVSVIDTDSFQIRDPQTGKTYRCLVGSEGFTPVELLGQELPALDQTEVHDRFRLAVIIHLLLFGDHPFKGKWIGDGESPTPTELLCQGFWPYAPNSLIQPGPSTISLSVLHPEVQRCFQRCFTDGHMTPEARPTAQDWSQALQKAIATLTVCPQEANHYYSQTDGHCYWCDRKAKLGVDIFSPVTVTAPSSPACRSLPPPLTKGPPAVSSTPRNGQTGTRPGLKSSPLKHKLPPRHASLPVELGIIFLLSAVCIYLLVVPDPAFDFQPDLSRPASQAIKHWFPSRNERSQVYPPVSALLSSDLSNVTPQIGHLDSVTCIAISPNGKILVTGSADLSIKLWNLQTGALIKTLYGHSDRVASVAISVDGSRLVSSSIDDEIILWNLQTAEMLRTLSGNPNWEPPGTAQSIAVSPDAKILASSGWGSTILLQSLQTGQVLRTLPGYLSSEQAIAISPNGQMLVSGGSDGEIKLWNLHTGRLIGRFLGNLHGESLDLARTIAISSDERTLVSGSWEGLITQWNLRTGQLLRSLAGHSDLINSLAISPDGSILASGSGDRTIKLWNLRTGQLMHTLSGHRGSVLSLAISPDSQTLASGSEDQTIKIWELRTGKLLSTLPRASAQ